MPVTLPVTIFGATPDVVESWLAWPAGCVRVERVFAMVYVHPSASSGIKSRVSTDEIALAETV